MLQIKQHFRDGILHKDEFKIVYVAPMKVPVPHLYSYSDNLIICDLNYILINIFCRLWQLR